ncbi:MAG: hypothetical protein KatS3mg108_0834 [Isosphaeraceae bacterium]|jgi:hypothetical protein|nr:MAG: hypothetical protein KatS3mg108_0834 [Isosphaeraceae bacterium]
MSIGVSRLGLHGLVIATAALGLFALKSPGGFWLGAVAMLTAGWIVMGLGLGCVVRGLDRAAWLGFVVAASISLLLSFGPWSDADRRAAWPQTWNWSSQSSTLQPVSRVLVSMLPLVRPQTRAVIQLDVPQGPVVARVEVVGPFDRLDGMDPIRDRIAQLAAYAPSGLPPAERVRRAGLAAESSLSLADYQAIGHLLAALVLGGLAGLMVRMIAAHRGTAPAAAAPASLRGAAAG